MAGSFLQSGASSIYESLITKDLYYKFLSPIQSSINYRVDKEFTNVRFANYISKLSNALQLFYCVDSILAYDNGVSNKNPGMRGLRTLLTAEIMSEHERLKRALLDAAIPANLVAFICFMYQNFRFDNLPYSPIYKLAFRGIFHSSGKQTLSADYYDVIISELREDTQVTSLLLKAFPKMRVDELPPSSKETIYDRNFMSFWYNSCISYMEYDSQIVQFGRTCKSDSENLYYGHFCDDDVDGLFYASCSIRDDAKSKIEPGLWTPLSDSQFFKTVSSDDQRTSLLCYSNGNQMFAAPRTHRTASQSGVFSSVYYDARANSRFLNYEYLNPSAQRVQVHNINNTGQAVSESVMHLFTDI